MQREEGRALSGCMQTAFTNACKAALAAVAVVFFIWVLGDSSWTGGSCIVFSLAAEPD